jgi:hypothetical protein
MASMLNLYDTADVLMTRIESRVISHNPSKRYDSIGTRRVF